ncbi:MAG: NAD(P)/FAD-dependent oxidoreductase [Promethearchaeota archaeon]|jgi:sarcosine oxidase subunit beta
MVEYDVIIIGAGSVGVPTALAMSKDGLKTLVIDSLASVAQADNKHAIGGIRATHSHIGKALLCQRSIEIFTQWEEKYGDDIWWIPGGYIFLAFTRENEKTLKDTVKFQKGHGLNIDFIDANKIEELVPGINREGLIGGTYSPEDGSASPLLALHAFFRQSKNFNAEYRFNEKVIDILTKNNKVIGIKTTKNQYKANLVVNAAGAHAKEVGSMIGVDLPVEPESHEAGITEPVKNFFKTMVVDIRPSIDPKFGNSKNYYFYQNKEGKILFCLTPNPNILGIDRRETSSFLPQISKRMIELLPRLRNIKIRRTWRGLYPMTPDGNPIIGYMNGIKGYINAVGMCGQGFMLGPGLGELISRLALGKTSSNDMEILNSLAYDRDFSVREELK